MVICQFIDNFMTTF
uniref:Uncharacterized protein n=1 Tax=Arundo donax TaxID=35708 RepID=A0A0A9C5V8_ARUDO